MSRAKSPEIELQQLKTAISYLADQWQEASPVQAETLRALLPKIEALHAGSPERLILASVHEAKLQGLESLPGPAKDGQDQ